MASDAGQLYYCHQCARAVIPSVTTELICPNCNGDFLEEWPRPSPETVGSNAAAYPASVEWALMAPGFGQLLEDMSSFLTHMHTVQTAEGGSPGFAADSAPINPILALRDRIQNLLTLHNREVPYEHGAGVLPHRMPGSFGDYFVGPGFEQLLQQLAENDPNRHGSPPASKSAVAALPTVFISKDHLGTDSAHCAVCKDEFELYTQVKQMPCKHLYHADCILPWLLQHNSCPVCRYELPTDDPDYEQSCAQGFRAGSSSDRPGAQDGASSVRDRETTGFSIQGIPRQFLLGRQPRERNASTQQHEHRPSGSQHSNGRGRGGSQGTSRRFSITFPWFRGFTATLTSPFANAQGGNASQPSSAETVSSGPNWVADEAVGQPSMDRNGDASDSNVAGGRRDASGS